ncbi:VOC family protein [Marinobacterium rhizophilum]|uniref:VOC family protein n=1 Tax=Marinobacterium rhizophilum TaxID=420402 RepID=A0ABY5HDQ5_9GAMM|nr:VOC family protein [Marinobacterium rhizophilum]UTW10343.1 VOC family protein [Marinobacterium rhizophilum]
MSTSARITHLALHVTDMAACVTFYQDFCGMRIIHERHSSRQTISWMAEPGRERDFIFVLMDGGQDLNLPDNDYRHFGFALDSREAVDRIAQQAEKAGCLVWAPRDEPFPVGYYCGLRDPNGNYVEFSYGQPLGPGADAFEQLLQG